ncbi:FGGY-family carbohydrate kinase [Gloeobacter kilaueensis]|uniref:Xylulokinase n=1 Tax=Gloeobacter kilaueensis (strain ATCC BAA-2537 / CCAP 1431/1 / ULC 316 / JS1) TaxID=1183438 RepID=U5QH52_GLOK1|nr:FGGY-family carbohydrate kinase [Gloeobacter kilaueensis]AGY56975.1 xylulokinase [Gloeobacter kilaueensis JS1]
MLSHAELFIGIDLGSSGLRLLAVDSSGQPAAESRCGWPVVGTEQDPLGWLVALETLWPAFCRQLAAPVRAVAITSTSGTVLATDRQGRPISPAWLYSDCRGAKIAARFGIAASWGLSRWLWWQDHGPADCLLVHPSDFLLMAMGAAPGWTDHTCALKSGYDPESGEWRRALAAGIPAHQLPAVVRPGTVLGRLDPRWNLGDGVQLVAGCTDGVAGQIAAGALSVGEVCLSLGSTLIFKGVSTERIEGAGGAVYSHLHPDGNLWLPGAASACGGAILEQFYPKESWDTLNGLATGCIPTGSTAYPLSRPGERFPITESTFSGALPEFAVTDPRFFAGLLEGVAFVERLGLEQLERLGMPRTGRHFCVGGGNRSPLWLRLRAAVLGTTLHLPLQAEPALGAAILAAAGASGLSVAETAARMTRAVQSIEPDRTLKAACAPIYRRFVERWQKRSEDRSSPHRHDDRTDPNLET